MLVFYEILNEQHIITDQNTVAPLRQLQGMWGYILYAEKDMINCVKNRSFDYGYPHYYHRFSYQLFGSKCSQAKFACSIYIMYKASAINLLNTNNSLFLLHINSN